MFFFQSSKSERSASRTPLHAVSPAQSTRVPQAPATTPATHGQMSPLKLYRDQSGMSSSSNKKPKSAPSHQNISRENVQSPTAEIRAPTNSPRALTPEQTGNYYASLCISLHAITNCLSDTNNVHI